MMTRLNDEVSLNSDEKQFYLRTDVMRLEEMQLHTSMQSCTFSRILSRAIPVTRLGGFCLGVLAEETPERITS